MERTFIDSFRHDQTYHNWFLDFNPLSKLNLLFALGFASMSPHPGVRTAALPCVLRSGILRGEGNVLSEAFRCGSGDFWFFYPCNPAVFRGGHYGALPPVRSASGYPGSAD